MLHEQATRPLSRRSNMGIFILETLSTIPLFSQLDAKTLLRVASQLKQKTFKRREVIFHIGAPSDSVFIVKSGKVKLTSTTPKGELALLNIVGEKDYFGEYALIDDTSRSVTATSIGITEAIILPRDAFLALVRDNVDFAKAVFCKAIQRVRMLNKKVSDIYFLDLPTRLGQELLDLGQNHGVRSQRGVVIDVYLTQTDIAEICGATRVSVNKIVGDFRRKGWLEIVDRRFVIVDMISLKQFVNERMV